MSTLDLDPAGGPSIETLAARSSQQALFDAFAAQEKEQKARHAFNCSHVKTHSDKNPSSPRLRLLPHVAKKRAEICAKNKEC